MSQIIASGMTIEVAKALRDGFASLKGFSENSQDVTRAFDSMNGFLTAFNPIAVPIQMITTALSAGSLEGTMKALDGFMTLATDPDTQEMLLKLGRGLGDVLGFFGDIAKLVAEIDFKQAKENLKAWWYQVLDIEDVKAIIAAKLQAIWDSIVEAITAPFQRAQSTVAGIVDHIEETITAPFDRIQAVLAEVARIITETWSTINPFD